MNDLIKIIEQRFSLQSTQRSLSQQFGFNYESLDFLKSKKFMNSYQSWEESKKNKFIVIIGGKANFNKTKLFIENII